MKLVNTISIATIGALATLGVAGLWITNQPDAELGAITLQKLKDKADPALVDFWKELSTREDAYYAKHGHYFQLLNSDTVVDGVDTNLVLRMPTDAKNTMDMLTSYATKVPFKLRVDTFDGPDGQGYKLYIEVVVNGKIYRRNRDSDNVDSGWSLHTPSSLV